mgnify:CR=1 FL=1
MVKESDKIKLAKEIHADVRKTNPSNKIIILNIDETWSIDLLDLVNLSKYNDGYK